MGLTCRDCLPGSTRPVKGLGRCATHLREEKKRRAERARELRLKKVYGLEPGEYAQIKAAQGGKCFICQRATGASKALAVDHDHTTGYVRGLLCGPCNQTVGQARDDIAYFERAINYLTSPPAQAMGIYRKGAQ